MRRAVALGLAIMLLAGVGLSFSENAASGLAASNLGNTQGSMTLNITSPHQDQYVDSTIVNVTWETGSTTGITGFQYKLNNGNWTSAGSTKYHMFYGLPEFINTVVVRMTVTSGATLDSSVTFYVDTQKPELKIISPANHDYLNTTNVNVTWQASDASGITYYEISLDSGPLQTPLYNNSWIYTFDQDKAHTVMVIAHDGSGQTTVQTVTFNVDITYPTLTIILPSEGKHFDESKVTVEWQGYDAGSDLDHYEVWLNGIHQYDLSKSSKNTTFTNLDDGNYSARIVAVDMANSTAVQTVNFTVDTVTPTIVSSSPTGSGVAVDSPINVTFSELMDPTTSVEIGGVSGTISWDGKNLTFVPSVYLSFGTTYTVTLKGKDLAGNALTSSWSFTTTDMGTIAGRVVDKSGNPVADATVSLDGISSVTTDATGTYKFQAHAGSHTITISKKDYETRSESVDLIAGDAKNVGDKTIEQPDIIDSLGWIIAIAAIVIVGALIYVGYRRKKRKGPQMRGPPTNAKSWQGADQMKNRSKADKETSESGRKHPEDDFEL